MANNRDSILSLGQVPMVAVNINSLPVKTIRLVHKLIFDYELRKFTGFDFEVESDDYIRKIAYIEDNFTERELIVICGLLTIDSEGIGKDLKIEIVNHLMNLKLLFNGVTDDEDESEDEDEDDNRRGSESGLGLVQRSKELNGKRNVEDKERRFQNEGLIRNGGRIQNGGLIQNGGCMQNGSQIQNGCQIQNGGRDVDEEQIQQKDNRVRLNFAESSISFRDVEDFVRQFDGKNDYPVESWISDFEDTACMMGWS